MRLSLGCGCNLLPPPWVNVDHAEQKVPEGYEFHVADVLDYLRETASDSVDLIHCEHMLDHLPVDEAIATLRECKRVLVRGGIMRLVVMDMEAVLDAYRDGGLDRFARWQPKAWRFYRSPLLRLSLFLFGSMSGQHPYTGHWWSADWAGVRELCTKAGFGDVQRMGYGQSQSRVLQMEVPDAYPDHSLYVEVRK